MTTNSKYKVVLTMNRHNSVVPMESHRLPKEMEFPDVVKFVRKFLVENYEMVGDHPFLIFKTVAPTQALVIAEEVS